MLVTKLLFTGMIAGITVASGTEDHLFAALLKRQEPGTPAYNCHDNCGEWTIFLIFYPDFWALILCSPFACMAHQHLL